jgi:glc operon protein GlcG
MPFRRRRRTLKRDEHGTRFFLHPGMGRGPACPGECRVNAALSDSILAPDRNQFAMMKPGISVGLLATVLSLPVGAQTIKVITLDQAGAQTVLQAAKESAQHRNAPSAIAVVDPAGDLLAFQRMDGVRPASADLAIQKARTAARLQRPTAEIEDNINHGRTAFVTADIAALRGGMPIRVNGEVVGGVGVAGLNKDTDTEIANTAAAVLGPSAKTQQQN